MSQDQTERLRMERDWECIRAILLALASLPKDKTIVWPKELDDFEEDIVSYHMRILMQAGLIEGDCSMSGGRTICHASRMTWQGQELFAAIKKHSTWERVKTTAKDKGVALSFEVLKAIATSFVARIV